jgi:hypothetical protein
LKAGSLELSPLGRFLAILILYSFSSLVAIDIIKEFNKIIINHISTIEMELSVNKSI